jgi:hypothetical protein
MGYILLIRYKNRRISAGDVYDGGIDVVLWGTQGVGDEFYQNHEFRNGVNVHDHDKLEEGILYNVERKSEEILSVRNITVRI